MKGFIVILAIMAVIILVFGNGAGGFPVSENPGENMVIGGETDTHSCIIPAGYSWCESSQKCLRTWEEPCQESTIKSDIGITAGDFFGSILKFFSSLSIPGN